MSTLGRVEPSTDPRPGDLVTVPLAPPVGQPSVKAKQYVAVEVKPLTSSITIWTSLALVAGSVLDAVLEVFIPMIAGNEPLDVNKLWRPLLVAALSAVIAWRRKQQNTIIGDTPT